MDLNISLLRSKKQYKLALIMGWIFVWFLPWQVVLPVTSNVYIAFVVDMIRLGIALIGFILPGVFLYLIIDENPRKLADICGTIAIGFTFSVALITTLGVVGRITGLSFQAVKVLFVLVGTLEIIILAFFRSRPNEKQLLDSSPHPWARVKEYLPLFLVILLSVLLTFHDRLLFIDDLTYLAYITNWQHSSQLGFSNIVHQSDVLEFERFWLAMYPMGQALLSDLSGVPGILLIANYLELFLVPIAVLASYWFGRELGLSRKASALSVLIQVALFSWMVGEEWPVGKWFFESMGEDKVSAVFHLAPVFFVFVLRFLDQPVKKNLLLILVSGVALTLTHPVILLFSCGIAVGLALLSWSFGKANWKAVVGLAVSSVILVLPFFGIKLYNYSKQIGFALDTSSVGATYQIERYTNIVSDLFYGMNPGALLFFDIPHESNFYDQYQFVRMLPVLVTLCAWALSIFRLKRGPLFWYVFVSSSLILIATIPYTGWILGYFVGARLVSRAAWFMPLGLGGLIILYFIAEKIESMRMLQSVRKSNFYRMLNGFSLWFLLSLVFISPLVLFGSLSRIPEYFEFLQHNIELARVGDYIDRHSEDPVTAIALDYTDTQLLPGVSAKTRLISFREEMDYNGFNNFMTLEEIHQRIRASNAIRSLEEGIPVETRCELIADYEVRFVVAAAEDFGTYTDIIRNCGDVEIVFATRNLVLMEFKNYATDN